MTHTTPKPLGRPPVRLGERMHIRVKDYEGRLFDEVLLAEIVRAHHSVRVKVLDQHPIWRGTELATHQFVEVKG